MAEKQFNTRIKHKRDLEENWTTNDPVLLNGEVAFVDGANGLLQIKIGDGVLPYSSLETYTLVPNATINDNGKVLSVSNGSAIWSEKYQYNIELMTQEEYDTLNNKDNNTLYIIEV